MKKLFLLLICSIISIPSVLCMKRDRKESYTLPMKKNTEKSIAQPLPYELVTKILLTAPQKVHTFINKKDPNPAQSAHHIILTMSLVNSDLCKELNKERNNPVTTRNMVKVMALLCNLPQYEILQSLKTPGAKKCYRLSNQLYRNNLKPNEVERLFKNGALLEWCTINNPYVLTHWTQYNTEESMEIMTKLLELGADPNEYHYTSPLDIAIQQDNVTKIKKILCYKPIIRWSDAITENNPEVINLLIANSQQNDLDNALISCTDHNTYVPQLMQHLIANGANPDAALFHILNKPSLKTCPLDPDDLFIKNLNFLCEQGAFDKTALTKLQMIQSLFGSLVNKLKKNRLI